MVIIKKHTNKEVRAAIEYAISKGWIFTHSNGHCFGRLRCGSDELEHNKHQLSVYSTPKSPENHAKQIIRLVDRC